MNLIKEVEELITKNLPGSHVQITDLTGGSDHLGITVVSEAFQDKILIDQHQMIMDILKTKLSQDLHAVQLKTLTPERAKAQGMNV